MTFPSFGDTTGLFPIYLAETLVEYIEAASNAFAFSSTTTNNYTFKDATNTFAWVNEVQMEAIEVLASDRLFFYGAYAPEGQDVQHNYFWEDAADTFAFTELSGYDQELNIRQYIGFTPRYFAPDLINYIGFEGNVRTATIKAAENTFDWIDHEDAEAWPRALHRTYNIANAFVFVESAEGGDNQDIYDAIGFVDTVDASDTVYDRDTGELGLVDRVTFKITGARCVEKEFSPYVGAGTDGFPTFSATAPTLSTGVLTLTYPRVGPSLTVTLKNPIFGNSDILTFPKIDRTTRGGERVIFSDPDWGSAQVLEMTVENICSPDIDDILTFLNASLGKDIGLADWEGRNWSGVILAPQTDVVKTIGGWQLRLVFEGELV